MRSGRGIQLNLLDQYSKTLHCEVYLQKNRNYQKVNFHCIKKEC